MNQSNQSENPVINRVRMWANKMSPSMDFFRLLRDEALPFILPVIHIAELKSDVPKKTWYDYVDGIIYLHVKNSNPKFQKSYEEIMGLVSEGFSELVNYAHSPDFQKVVLSKYQYRTDLINIGGGNQTKVNAKALFKFGSEYGEYAFEESTFKELKNRFLEVAKREYQITPPKESIQKNDGESGLTVKRLALLLYYQNQSINHHDFDTIAQTWGFLNGNKLSKTFSIFTDRLRRVGPHNYLNSTTQIMNRAKDFNWVLQRLPEEFKGRAEEELKYLKTRLLIEE